METYKIDRRLTATISRGEVTVILRGRYGGQLSITLMQEKAVQLIDLATGDMKEFRAACRNLVPHYRPDPLERAAEKVWETLRAMARLIPSFR